MRSKYAREEGGQTKIGCLHTYSHREGPHTLSIEIKKDAPGHVHEERKASAITMNRVLFLSNLEELPFMVIARASPFLHVQARQTGSYYRPIENNHRLCAHFFGTDRYEALILSQLQKPIVWV